MDFAQQRLSESSSLLAKNVHEHLARELSALHESLQRHQDLLAQLPDVKAHLQRPESVTSEEAEKYRFSWYHREEGREHIV